MTVRAVVFDLDYTLAVPERDRSVILQDAAAVAGADEFDREAYLDAHERHVVNETRAPIFEALLADHAVSADPEQVAAAYRESIADALTPIVGAESLLSSLREEYAVGLLTNGPSVAQRDKLATLGWEDAFDAVAIAGEIGASKPDPAAFDAVLSELGVPASAAVHVGDERDADVAGATNAGLRAVQVTFEGGPAADERAVAHLTREELAARLPVVLDEFSLSDVPS